MNILGTFFSGENEKILNSLMEKYAISSDQLQGITTTLLPKITETFQSSLMDPEVSGRIMGALSSIDLSSIQNDPKQLFEGNMQSMGKKLFDTIMGGEAAAGQMISELGKQFNIQQSSLASFLSSFMPAIFGVLSQDKGLSSLVTTLMGSQGASEGGFAGLAKAFLDKDGDGSIADDLLAQAKKFF